MKILNVKRLNSNLFTHPPFVTNCFSGDFRFFNSLKTKKLKLAPPIKGEESKALINLYKLSF
ncbi:hypothetical protein J2W55_003062 [Mucilaginibacter pocheonensis]|uniref:Uncharacterized protein n=1 Tax=Mucilaginibacter pocheonensis TaxID=398050 RepID=A0ABU1TCU2_9SPHI|nr:hypothetical protein [Mucilaginibacter pocheonensis]